MKPPSSEALFSIIALRRAWQQVRRNGISPGSDGVTAAAFEARLEDELNRLRQQILAGAYQPQPLRRYFQPKPSGKRRPICIWSLRDRVAQRVVHDYLTPMVEPLFLECSYGFRPGRGVQDAVNAIVRGRDTGLRWVVDADIEDCFGSISSPMLMAHVRAIDSATLVETLIERWLYAPIHAAPGQTAGVSQGGVISPLLANLYLHCFDRMIQLALPERQLVRFADDFIILTATRRDALWSLDVARHSLACLQLRLNARKTRIAHFDSGFAFLGIAFKRKDTRPLADSPKQEHEA